MPLSRRIARLNRVGLNRVMRHITPWLPGFGVVVHHGRRSGIEYRTPLNLFRRPGGYVVALTYGTESDWVRNVLAAGTAYLTTRGRTVTVTNPRIVRDEQRSAIPLLPRTILGWLNVNDFLLVDRVDHSPV